LVVLKRATLRFAWIALGSCPSSTSKHFWSSRPRLRSTCTTSLERPSVIPVPVSTVSLPSLARTVRADLRARLRTFLGSRAYQSRGCGPLVGGPPTQTTVRVDPERARPVPFWRQGLTPPPETVARVLVSTVP